MIFWSILLTIGVAMAAMWAIRMLSEHVVRKNYLIAIGAALAIGVVNRFMPDIAKVAWLSLICLIALIGLSCKLMAWFHKDVSDFREAIPFAALMLMNFFVIKAAAVGTMGIIPTGTLATIVDTFLKYLPTAILVAQVLYGCYDIFTFEDGLERAGETEEGDELE